MFCQYVESFSGWLRVSLSFGAWLICKCVRRFLKNRLTTLRALGIAAFRPGQEVDLSADARQARAATTGRAPVMGGGRLSGPERRLFLRLHDKGEQLAPQAADIFKFPFQVSREQCIDSCLFFTFAALDKLPQRLFDAAGWRRPRADPSP